MKTPQSFKNAALIIGVGLTVCGQAQVITLNNSNYGLIAGERQFFTVNNPYSTQVEQFNYTVTGPFDHTTPILSEGVVYDIKISGRVGVGPLDGSNNSTPDAAYCFVNWQNLDLVHSPYQSPVVTWDNVGDGTNYRRPSPDTYSTAHVYDYYIEGHNAGLAFSFRDNPYGDNIGGYQVTIFEVGVVPEPSSLALISLGLVGLTWSRRWQR